MKSRILAPTWQNAAISRTCEVHTGKDKQCGLEAASAYPAYGRGWMALCETHGAKHKLEARPIKELLKEGNRLASFITSAPKNNPVK